MVIANPEMIETKSRPKQKQLFDARQVMLDVFRVELSVLLKDAENKLTRPFNTPPDYDERYFIDRVVQDRDKIESAMMQQLQSQGIRLSRWQIRDFLKDVTQDVKAGKVNAPDYAPRIKTEAEKLAENAKKEEKKQAKKLAEQAKRDKKKTKRGKRRPVVVNGNQYESISQANSVEQIGYDYIKRHSLKEDNVI